MKTKIPADVRNIIAEMERLLQALKVKLEDLADAQPEYRPSSHPAPAGLSHEKMRTARNSMASDLYNTPIRRFDNPPARVDPNLGTL